MIKIGIVDSGVNFKHKAFVSSHIEENNNFYMIDNMYYNQYKNLKIIEKKFH